MNRKRVIVLAAVTLLCFVAYTGTADTLTGSQRSALVVLIVASGLWTTEAVPLVATCILIPLMQAFFGIQGFGAALAPFFDTVV
ncbi:hypothetical protein JXL21_13905, partial [Candidatus Bathyarchaeota archaeon]|nr:hypothetical protein [Candidatus Bathyarchaeota archaeon]